MRGLTAASCASCRAVQHAGCGKGSRSARAREATTSGEGTTTTARSACWITSRETLPSNSDLTPVSPRDPITIAVASSACAWRRIARAVVGAREALPATALMPRRVFVAESARRTGEKRRRAQGEDNQRELPSTR
jgi:hypothetical protein